VQIKKNSEEQIEIISFQRRNEADSVSPLVRVDIRIQVSIVKRDYSRFHSRLLDITQARAPQQRRQDSGALMPDISAPDLTGNFLTVSTRTKKKESIKKYKKQERRDTKIKKE
jgi:hypothetical protein